MPTEPSVLLLVLDLTGTFAFALNGALTAVRAARLDIVGVMALGLITAVGGGILRDVLIGSVPPVVFVDWRYPALATGGAFIAFLGSQWLERLEVPINVLDAVGLSTFAVIGASKALESGLGIGPAIVLGAITGVGGGTIRDVLVRRVPTVLHSDLYAIPALIGAAITAVGLSLGLAGGVVALVAVLTCFAIRMAGVHFRLQAPLPPGING